MQNKLGILAESQYMTQVTPYYQKVQGNLLAGRSNDKLTHEEQEEIKRLRKEIHDKKMQERKINLINCYASTNVKVMKSLDAQKLRNSS